MSAQTKRWDNIYHLSYIRYKSSYLFCLSFLIKQLKSQRFYKIKLKRKGPRLARTRLVREGAVYSALQWRHNGRDGVSTHRRLGCLLNRFFRLRSKKTSKLRVTGLCAGNSPVTGDFPAQRASNAENVSIWWRHHSLSWVLILAYCNTRGFILAPVLVSIRKSLSKPI